MTYIRLRAMLNRATKNQLVCLSSTETRGIPLSLTNLSTSLQRGRGHDRGKPCHASYTCHTTHQVASRFGWILPLLLISLTLLSTNCSAANSGTSIPANKPSTTSNPATHIPTFPSTPTLLPNAIQINAYLTGLMSKGVMNGSVLVAHNGKVFDKGYGVADKENLVLNTPQTRFRLGSVSKQFTAMAILMLQERGKLHVQDHLCLYIPSCPQDWQPITIEHLLTHTSGIPDYTNFPDFAVTWTQAVTVEQLIARFKDMPLQFSPGSVFRYSSSGYVLLGYIVERVSHMSYATFLQQRIFDPLALHNTGYDTQYPSLPQHATGYYPGYIKPDAYDMSVLYAAGALYSTVEDMYVWDQALAAHSLVSQQSLDAMFALHASCPSSGPGGCLMHSDLGYGYGWFIAQEPEGRLIYHVGRIDGFLAYNGFYLATNTDVVVLSNLETTDVLQIGRTLGSMV